MSCMSKVITNWTLKIRSSSKTRVNNHWDLDKFMDTFKCIISIKNNINQIKLSITIAIKCNSKDYMVEVAT